MPKHETALTDGQMAEFVSAGTKALILITNELGADLAGQWARNGELLQGALLSVLRPKEEKQEIPAPPKPCILRKIVEVTISKCAGTRTIADSSKLFSGYLDSSFKKIKGNRETPDTKTDVHEMVENAAFAQVFNSLGRDLNTLVFTQDQVVEFCTNHRDKLRTDGYGTFFLLKEGNNFFVASVYVSDGGRLEVGLDVFESGYVWLADYRPRVVVPQL